MRNEPYFDDEGAALPRVRPEPRTRPRQAAQGHVRGVEATAGGLLRATLGSAAAAAAILVLFWLPAEYAIDPTGLGRVMGLTEMGEIKQQLYAEAEADHAAIAAQVAEVPAATRGTDPEVLVRLAAIEAQLAAIASAIGTPPAAPTAPGVPEPDMAALLAPDTAQTTPAPIPPVPPTWRDAVSYTLAPTEGIEIKLVMQEGAEAEFAWTANGSVLNVDTHGDGGGQRISYEQGRGVPGQEGTLVAAFTGNHGWFWRNRTDAPVTFTLRTRGDYIEMRTP